jgi:hypothetical protein
MYFKEKFMDINRSNYESFFLLYLDGELGQTEKNSVEKFLSENTDLQKEFSLLKVVRMVPEEISFDNKQVLFHKEDSRKIMPVYWMRIAGIMLLGIAGSWLVFTHNWKGTRDKNTAQVPHISKKVPVDHIISGEKSRLNEQSVAVENEKRETDKKKNKTGNDVVKNSDNERGKKDHAGNPVRSVNVTTDDLPVTDQALTNKENAAIQSTAMIQPQQAELNEGINISGVSTPLNKTAPVIVPSSVGSEEISKQSALVTNNTDQGDDVSISVLALNNKKPISGFFKKIIRNTSLGGSQNNSRTVKVSVFQFNY